jgi:hypothetical protein
VSDSAIISDPYRSPIVAQKRTDSDGGVAIRGPRSGVLILSEPEVDRLVAFARDESRRARLQRYPMNGH